MKIRVTRTTDVELVRSIVSEPESFAIRAEDGVTVDDVMVVINPLIYWLLLISEEAGKEPEVRGVAVGTPLTRTVADFHIVIRPQYWRSGANVKLAELAAKYLLKYSGAEKIVSTVPEPAQPVIRFLQRAGFKREGINRASFRKNGQLVDQVYLGYTGE